MKQPTLEGRLVTLRPLRESDAPRLVGLLRDRRISKYTQTQLYPPPSIAKEKAWIRRTHQDATEGKAYSWVVVYNETNKVTGVMSLMKVENTKAVRQAETGTWLARDYWGRGLNNEAKRLMINFALRKLGLERIELKCMIENIRSAKAIEKLGAKYEGTERHAMYTRGKWRNLRQYSITRADWIRGKK